MKAFNQLLEKIKNKKAKIGIIGQGYVGLPLAVCFAKHGFQVTGLDIDEKKVRAINRGENYLPKMGIDSDFKKVVKKGFLRASSNIVAGCRKQDVIIICVPTPVNERRQPDISLLKKAAASIGEARPLGKLIINESTVAPLTTVSIVGSLIEKKSGLKVGLDFFLGCSPERVNPGDLTHRVENTPKIVAGLGKKDLSLVESLYRTIIKAELVKVSNLATAETVKLLENSFRAVNIALINELAEFCQEFNLDVLEIIEAAKTKWSFQAHYPGIGVGGHCIPVDPYYLLDLAARRGIKMTTLKEALAQNESMPKFILKNFLKFYQPGKSVLVYGLTYKAGVKDVRESPAMEFCHLLKTKRIKFEVYDPFYTHREIRNFGFTPCRRLKQFDLVAVATGHYQLVKDSQKIIDKDTIIIDGRNFFLKKVGKKIIGVGRKMD